MHLKLCGTPMSGPDVDRDRLAALLAKIERELDTKALTWPGGWPGQIEAALLDAVYSVRARYGSPTTGVRRVVRRWIEHRGELADDLTVLAQQEPADLARIVGNSAKASRRLKAAIVIDAAGALADAGLQHAADFTGSDTQQRAYLSVTGCGPVTWSYLGMLLGKPGVKADTWIVRFVNAAAVGPVTPKQAEHLVHAAADALGVTATQLDQAIWRTARAGTTKVETTN